LFPSGGKNQLIYKDMMRLRYFVLFHPNPRLKLWANQPLGPEGLLKFQTRRDGIFIATIPPSIPGCKENIVMDDHVLAAGMCHAHYIEVFGQHLHTGKADD
jgi:hypothetical protein